MSKLLLSFVPNGGVEYVRPRFENSLKGTRLNRNEELLWCLGKRYRNSRDSAYLLIGRLNEQPEALCLQLSCTSGFFYCGVRRRNFSFLIFLIKSIKSNKSIKVKCRSDTESTSEIHIRRKGIGKFCELTKRSSE